MKKTLHITLLLVSVLLLSACNGQVQETPQIPDPVVGVLDLSEKPIYQINEVGQIKAVQEVELIAKANGTIGQLSKKVGDPVAVDEVLAVVDFDEANNPARVNYDNAQIQLANARQNYDEAVANSRAVITQAQLRTQTLESTLARLQRNLDELEVTNESTKTTLELQLENAEKNADTADVNYNNIVDQFDQSWTDLINSTKTSLDGVFINLETNFSTAESIINPFKSLHFSASNMPDGLGDRDSLQRTSTINNYNRLRGNLESYRASYENKLPLSEYTLDEAISDARRAADETRQFVGQVRLLLQNSIVRGETTQTLLDSYITQVSTAETSVIAQVSTVDALEQSLASFKLDRTSQVATADNNRIIASNQLADAQNAVIQFQTTSFGSVQDLETQIAQTSNDLLSAQADLSSAYRSSGITTSGKDLEINTLQNQLRLAEKSLTDNKVTSSIDGVLSELVVDEGDYVSVGTYLGKVIQHESVKVVFYVSKENADRLGFGQAFQFSLTDNGSREYTGFINKISPSADPQNKKIKIEGAVQNEDFELKPETFINLSLDLSSETFDLTKVYVPMNAIIFAQNDQYVYLLEGELAVRRNIEVGRVFGMWIEVTSGLSKQDVLIVEGQRNLPPSGNVIVQVSP